MKLSEYEDIYKNSVSSAMEANTSPFVFFPDLPFGEGYLAMA